MCCRLYPMFIEPAGFGGSFDVIYESWCQSFTEEFGQGRQLQRRASDPTCQAAVAL
jgi:hypothetical protein